MNWPSLRVSKADILSGIPLSECKNSLLWTMCIMINLKSSIHVSSLVDGYDAVAVNCCLRFLHYTLLKQYLLKLLFNY